MSIGNNILVKLNNVGFQQNQKWLVQGVSLQVEKGKIVTLIGPNGSGKSTTAKIALGLFKNIEGQVEKFTNNIGYVPQKISIDWTLPLRVRDFMLLTDNLTEDVIDEALSLTGVINLKDKSLGNLSGGEFQRVLLARAISKKPDLLVLDEPHTVMSATDHVVCLNGHVCCSGSPKEVAKNSEYKALFGEQAAQTLSIYEHKHDHVHTSDGDIKKN